MKDKYWTLKILSGTHEGAEIPLGDGEFSIGSGEHCDLVLHDVSLGQEVGTIRITKDKAFITSEALGVADLEVVANQKMAMGGLTVGMMPAGEAWHESSGPMLDVSKMEDHKPASSVSGPSVLEKHKRRRTLVAKAVFALFFLAGLFLAYQHYYGEDEASFIAKEKKEKSDLAALIPASLQAVKNEKGVYVITGHLHKEAQKASLLKKLEGFFEEKDFVLDVEIQDVLLEAARISLNLQGMKRVEVEAHKNPAALVLTGFNDNIALWPKVKASLKKDIKGVKVWHDRVESNRDRAKVLEKMIEKKELSAVKVAAKRDRIEIFGSVPSQKSKELQGVLKEYKEKFDNEPPLATVKPLTKKLQIESVNLGETPYIVTVKGDVYMIGGQVETGVSIVAIHKDRMILKKRQTLFTYFYEWESK